LSAPDLRPALHRIFAAGLAAVDPVLCLPPCLPTYWTSGRTLVGGAGKAAARMALALTEASPGPVQGIVVTRYGHGLAPGEAAPGIEVIEAGHPVPDEAGVSAGRHILELARSAVPTDRFVFLISGGASALMVAPAPGITLADKQDVTRRLLAAGASIGEINCVRRKLSAIKGGRLAHELRAGDILLLALSDVPGDALADIGSGPLAADPFTLHDARTILARYSATDNPAIQRYLADPAHESPSPSDPALERVAARIIGRSADAVEAAAAAAAREGFPPLIVPEARGPALALAESHATAIRKLRQAGRRVALISGGETTVAVRNPGVPGGRNGEYALALALALGPGAGVFALAADTDGIDGSGENAGAVLTPDTLDRARKAGLDAAGLLAENRSLEFFRALGGLFVTGPTRTNANDLRIVLVG
jgi:glycerate 2-kinase